MTPETSTRFALEGFLPFWGVLAFGMALIGLAWWMARRDRHVADRPRMVAFLFGLRCLAILILLWMLAGPTLVTTARTFKRKAVALLVDRSASMGLVDVTDGSGNVSRWAAARNRGSAGKGLLALDAAIASVHASLNQLTRFSKLAPSTPQTAEARAALSRAVAGIESGLAAIRTAGRELPVDAGDVRRNLTEIAQGAADRVLEPLKGKSAEFNRGKTLASIEREHWLPEILAVLTTAAGRMEGIADQFAKTLDQPAAPGADSLPADESRLSRADKVETFMTAAEASWLEEIRQKATVQLYEFGDKIVPLGSAAPQKEPARDGTNSQTPHPLAPATHLGAALQQIALDSTAQNVAAAIIITDGGHNAGPNPQELAGSLSGTTLHLVPIGNTKMQRDIILHHTHAPKAVLQNDQVVIDSIVTAYDCDQEKLQVELLDNGRVVDRQALNVTGEVFDARVQLRWKAAQLGKHTLGFRVVPVSDERTEENNASKADVHVMEDKIRVLVADNYPRWETRYLLNLFKRDDRVSFDQLLFEPQLASGPGLRSRFPTSLEEWAKYRIVILGDLLPAQLTAEHQRQLKAYVTEAGGNLIVISGREAMPGAFMNQPLGSILPIEPGNRPLPANSPFYLHLTDEGSMSLATQIADNPGTSERLWREMSERLPVYGLSEFSKPKPTAHSLIWASVSKNSFNPGETSTRSFLSWQYVGAGRVVYLAAPVTYQLRYRQGDLFHHRFWGQLLRWAIARDLAEGSPSVRLSTDKSRYEQGEPTQTSVRLRQLDGRPVTGADVKISAIQDGKLIQEISLREEAARPGNYSGALEQLPVGPVKLQVSGERVKALLDAENYRRPVETTVTIDPSGQLELRHPLANMPLLRQLADASGGMVIPPTGLEAALRALNLDPEVLESVTKKPLWNRWDLFWLFLACLSLEWAGRKYLGLS